MSSIEEDENDLRLIKLDQKPWTLSPHYRQGIYLHPESDTLYALMPLCKAVIKSGANAGNYCTRGANADGYCRTHTPQQN